MICIMFLCTKNKEYFRKGYSILLAVTVYKRKLYQKEMSYLRQMDSFNTSTWAISAKWQWRNE
jgi:hypothetical protein